MKGHEPESSVKLLGRLSHCVLSGAVLAGAEANAGKQTGGGYTESCRTLQIDLRGRSDASVQASMMMMMLT